MTPEDDREPPPVRVLAPNPGHMARARRELRENLKLVDVVLELLDARAPLASRNPALSRAAGEKPRVIVLNKADLADPDATARWVAFFRRSGAEAVALEAQSGRGLEQMEAAVGRVAKKEVARVMLVGIPNVGKSSLLNRLAGRSRARVGALPGVTRGKQWVKTKAGHLLMDLPGIFPPSFAGENEQWALAVTGALPDITYDHQAAATRLTELLRHGRYATIYSERFGLAPEDTTVEPLAALARQRGYMGAGGRPDVARAADALLKDFRLGLLGRVTLEQPATAKTAPRTVPVETTPVKTAPTETVAPTAADPKTASTGRKPETPSEA